MAFGEQNPLAGEIPVSWQTWDNGSAVVPTIIGDANWGKLALNLNDQGRSKVYDFGYSGLVKITITENLYGTGQGTATIQYRYADALFAQDDVAPLWNDYTVPTNITCRYIQVRVIKNS